MRLSEIMSNMDLATWPVIGLVLFLGIFLGVLAYTFSRKRSGEFERAARIPLDDHRIETPHQETTR